MSATDRTWLICTLAALVFGCREPEKALHGFDPSLKSTGVWGTRFGVDRLEKARADAIEQATSDAFLAYWVETRKPKSTPRFRANDLRSRFRTTPEWLYFTFPAKGCGGPSDDDAVLSDFALFVSWSFDQLVMLSLYRGARSDDERLEIVRAPPMISSEDISGWWQSSICRERATTSPALDKELSLLCRSAPPVGSAAPSSAPSLASSAPPILPSSQPVIAPRVFITGLAQRAGAVDHEVTIRGIQTRTKEPSVCGVDVDGDYDLSDQRVVVHGILRRFEVVVPPYVDGGPHVASRSSGIYYKVVDPRTGELAKTRRER